MDDTDAKAKRENLITWITVSLASMSLLYILYGWVRFEFFPPEPRMQFYSVTPDPKNPERVVTTEVDAPPPGSGWKLNEEPKD